MEQKTILDTMPPSVNSLPKTIREIATKFHQAGFEISLVGGTVRGILSQAPATDWDMTTSAPPEEIQKLFPHSFYDNKFGTVGIPTEEVGVVEVTTYRTEGRYNDNRRPSSVAWGKSLDEDLKRRDFTINAMALKFDKSNLTLVDPFGGQADLKLKLVKAVGNPDERFKEDALRLLRAVRIATQLGFEIEKKTLEAISKNAVLITNVSGERIRNEIFKILSVEKSETAYEGFELLKSSGLLIHIIPELVEGFGVEQKSIGRHHIYDVGTHNFYALKFCPSPDPLVRFATLIHDIGKPKVVGKDEKGITTFYNHEVIGAEIAKEIADRLHFSKKEKEKLYLLVRWHQFTVDEFQTDKAIRRFIARVGVENIQDMMDLRIGDRLGSGIPKEKEESWRLKQFRQRIKKVMEKTFTINDLKINGKDVMEILNIEPGPKVGEVLGKIFSKVEDGKLKNEREILTEEIKKIK